MESEYKRSRYKNELTMEPKTKRHRYSKQFKKDVIQMINEGVESRSNVMKKYGILSGTLSKWLKAKEKEIGESEEEAGESEEETEESQEETGESEEETGESEEEIGESEEEAGESEEETEESQ